MGYTIPKKSYIKNKKMSTLRTNDFDENLKRLEEEIERRRKMHCYEQMGYQDASTNVCGATVCQQPEYTNVYDSQGMSCAKVSAAYMPNNQRHDDYSNATIEFLRNENQKLTAEIKRLVYERSVLVNHINQLNEENNTLKAKKEKKKMFDVKIADSFNKVGGGFSSLYQKFITWLNT